MYIYLKEKEMEIVQLIILWDKMSRNTIQNKK